MKPDNSKVNHPIAALALEFVGYERGLLKTIIDLYKDPAIVIASFNKGENTYVSPYRLLIVTISIWVLLNSFLIDWNEIWTSYMADIESVSGLRHNSFNSAIANFMADLFGKYIAPITIVSLVGSSLIANKTCRQYNLDLRQHMYVMSYSMGVNYLGYIAVSIAVAVSVPFTFIGILLITLMNAFGFRNYLDLVPVRRFFAENGKAIERKYLYAQILTIFFLMAVSAIATIIFKMQGQ